MNGGDVKRLRIQIGDHNIYSTSDGNHETRGARNVYYHKAFSMRTLVSFGEQLNDFDFMRHPIDEFFCSC